LYTRIRGQLIVPFWGDKIFAVAGMNFVSGTKKSIVLIMVVSHEAFHARVDPERLWAGTTYDP